MILCRSPRPLFSGFIRYSLTLVQLPAWHIRKFVNGYDDYLDITVDLFPSYRFVYTRHLYIRQYDIGLMVGFLSSFGSRSLDDLMLPNFFHDMPLDSIMICSSSHTTTVHENHLPLLPLFRWLMFCLFYCRLSCQLVVAPRHLVMLMLCPTCPAAIRSVALIALLPQLQLLITWYPDCCLQSWYPYHYLQSLHSDHCLQAQHSDSASTVFSNHLRTLARSALLRL